MPINPLILSKIDTLDISPIIKEILKETLRIEEEMITLHELTNYDKNICNLLQKYADNPEVRKFCENYESK